MMYFSSVNKSGFSLVEMLVSVSILLLVIIGPMSITTRIAKSSTFASEQVQAFFFAQEGLEIVQKVRDDLFLDYFVDPLANPNPWTKFTDEAGGTLRICYTGAGCGLEWDDVTAGKIETVQDCGNTGNCSLVFNPNNDRSKFTHTPSLAATSTPFTRKITLTKNPAEPNQVKVKSVVTWRTGSLVAGQTVEVETYLYNIYAR